MVVGLSEVIIHDMKEEGSPGKLDGRYLPPSLDLAWAGCATFLSKRKGLVTEMSLFRLM